MKRLRVRLILLTAMLILSTSVGLLLVHGRSGDRSSAETPASQFYVDCSLDHRGDGSVDRPWNSLASVDLHGVFAPGDRILLARGTTCHGRTTPSGSGTRAAPIVLGAYGHGALPTIAGDGTPDRTGAVELRDLHDWTVRDLHVTNQPTGPTDGAYRAGILVLNSAGGRIAGIDIENSWVSDVESDPGWRAGLDPHEFGGVAVITSSKDRSAGFNRLRISNNRVDGVGRVGIVTWNNSYPAAYDHEVTISGNSINRAAGDSILTYGVDGGVITRNVSADGGALMSCDECHSDPGNTASAGIWPTRSRNVVVSQNEVFGEHAARGDGEGLDIDVETTAVVLERNYVHDNEGGGVLICGAQSAIIRANVLEDNDGGAFIFNCAEPARDVSIVNNDVFAGSGIDGAVIRTLAGRGASGLIFANNIVSTAQTATWDWPGQTTIVDNTLLDLAAPTPPNNPTVAEMSPLRAIGTGDVGFESLAGYLPLPEGSGEPSAPIQGPANDLLGTGFDLLDPGRGAISTR